MSNHIKPGPKPKRNDGKDDRRHHVDDKNKKKHPTLPLHKPLTQKKSQVRIQRNFEI